jgi:hypothetical protein
MAVPLHFDETRTVTDDPNASFHRLSSHEAQALRDLGLSNDAYALYLSSMHILFMVAFTGIAIFLFSRRSDDWMIILLSLAIIIQGATYALGLDSLVHADPRWILPVNLLKSIGWVLGLWVFYLFPTGQFVPRWTAIPAAIWALWMLARPFIPALDPMNFPEPLGIVVFVVIYLSGVGAQIYRYVRISDATQKPQTRWIVFGMTVAILGFSIYALGGVIFPALGAPGLPRLLYNLIGVPLLIFGPMLMVPLSITMSILRFRLWDIDFVINRGLVLGGLTALLGVIFFGSIYVLQNIFQVVTNNQQSSVAVVTSALVIGTLFQPARHRLQRLVDRQIYGIKVDVQPARLTKSVEMPAVSREAERQLGPYTISGLLGRGGMGEVYKGYHPTLNREIAIKMLNMALAIDPEALSRFEREAQTVAALKHPNIIQVFDFGEIDGSYYMVMEYVPGEDLSTHIRNTGAMPLEQVRSLVRDIAMALDYAHSLGIVHRDIKPSNVMIRPVTADSGAGYRAVLMDFGVVKLRDVPGLTGTSIVGTADYVAPEQIRGEQNIDGRVDVYALGVMTFEMLTGVKPFENNGIWNLLMAHLNRPAPDPRDLRPDLPASVALTITQAMAKYADQRFPSAGAFAEALG